MSWFKMGFGCNITVAIIVVTALSTQTIFKKYALGEVQPHRFLPQCTQMDRFYTVLP